MAKSQPRFQHKSKVPVALAPKVQICVLHVLLTRSLLILSFFINFAASSSSQKPKETKMTFYVHDFIGGPNATYVNVAGIPGQRWSSTDFGSVYVANDIVREGLDPNSTIVGRTQGIYLISSPQGINNFWSATLIFTNTAYAGSTLEIQGRYVRYVKNSEVAIISGTGKFRFARGYAVITDISVQALDASTLYTISRFDIAIRLD